MAHEELSDFDVRSDAVFPLSDLTLEFSRFVHNVLPHLSADHLRDLSQRVAERLPAGTGQISYGAEYDIKVEIEGLINAVRAMQDSVMINGQIRPGITPREMREVVASTTTLLTLLVKTHEKFMGFDRQRALEVATIETLRQLGGEEIVSGFVEMMEERLSA